jgi:hypothetical protein
MERKLNRNNKILKIHLKTLFKKFLNIKFEFVKNKSNLINQKKRHILINPKKINNLINQKKKNNLINQKNIYNLINHKKRNNSIKKIYFIINMTNKKTILHIINKVIIVTNKIKFFNNKHNKYR